MKWRGRPKSNNVVVDVVKYSPFGKGLQQYPSYDLKEAEIDYMLQTKTPLGKRILRGTRAFRDLNSILESYVNGR